MAKIKPPRKHGQRVSSELPSQSLGIHRKKFWMDMSDGEFQYHLGMTHWKANLAWPFFILIFSMLILVVTGVRVTGLRVAWYDYFVFGLSILGTLVSIIWMIKISKYSNGDKNR